MIRLKDLEPGDFFRFSAVLAGSKVFKKTDIQDRRGWIKYGTKRGNWAFSAPHVYVYKTDTW